jgi:hypothetical protein
MGSNATQGSSATYVRSVRSAIAAAVSGLLASCLFVPACALAAEPVIGTAPTLQPSFSSSVPDYVTRCEPLGRVEVSVRAEGNPVSVDGAPAQTGNFVADVTLASGQAFAIQVGTGGSARTYTVRCLPSAFPQYTVQIDGARQAAYYLMTPCEDIPLAANPAHCYVAIFDSNGVPVWWYHPPQGIAVDADLDPNGDLSWALDTGGYYAFGLPGRVRVEQRGLDGNLANILGTSGTPTDFHEAWPLANGNFLITSYVLQTEAPVLLSGKYVDTVDASFQEIEPDGSVAYSWSSAGRIGEAASIDYPYTLFYYPGLTEHVWDWQHIDAVMPYKNGYLISLRQNNAVYYIEAATGDVVWKLGGTQIPQSLKIIGDPHASQDLGSQHDVRAWPDGTVSVMDDGSRFVRPPRVVRFRINEGERTATLIETIADPSIRSSICCGSARLLPGGDWVVAWGETRYVEELTPASEVVFRLAFAPGDSTYRAVPILSEQLSLSSLIDAMNQMHPLAPADVRAQGRLAFSRK